MRRASPRAPRREKSSFSLQLIKGIMVVENRLCCPWLLMSCLQAANEDCIEFCCLSYYITLQSSVETSSERWPSAVRVSKTLSCTIVFYVYGEQKGNSLDALLFFFYMALMPIFCSHYTERNEQQTTCLLQPFYRYLDNEMPECILSLGA